MEVGQDRVRRIAHHHVGLPIVERPLRELAALGVIVEHGGGDVGADGRIEHGHQLRLGAVDVPPREVGVLGMAGRQRVHLVVEAHVLPVDVAEDVRVQEGVVERAVEDGGVGGRPATHLNPSQQRVPRRECCRPHRIEAPPRVLGAGVELRVGLTHVRDARLDQHRRVAGRGGEGGVEA